MRTSLTLYRIKVKNHASHWYIGANDVIEAIKLLQQDFVNQGEVEMVEKVGELDSISKDQQKRLRG